MHNLTRAHQVIGNYEKARELVDRCQKIRWESLGNTSDATLATRKLQAALLRDMGDAD